MGAGLDPGQAPDTAWSTVEDPPEPDQLQRVEQKLDALLGVMSELLDALGGRLPFPLRMRLRTLMKGQTSD